MTTVSFSKHFAFLLIFALVLVGCSNDDKLENPDADNTTLYSFSFNKNYNNNLSSNVSWLNNNGTVYITVPEGADLKSLVPTFSVAKGANVTINGIEAISDITPCDFSNTTTVTVTSENGFTRNYTLLVKNGNPKIDNMIYSFMIKHSIPGVSVAVSKDEETVYKAGYGYAVVSTRQRVTPQTLFRLASMSKQQTAIAIMTLYEKGLLRLEDRVFGKGGILEGEFGTNVLSGVDDITVKHLLQHTGGWKNDPIYITASTTLEQRIASQITSTPLAYNPGTTFDYSNFGFCVLGKIIEKLSGKDYETFLKEEIHAKAGGIKNILVGRNTRGGRYSNECEYYGQGGKDAYGNDVELSKAAGGMIASTEELMRLMSYIDYGTKVPDILKKETLDLMYTPLEKGTVDEYGKPYIKYALGWRTEYTDSHPDWEAFHGGTLAGVATIWARNSRNVNGVILCNSRSYDMNIDSEMWNILENIQNLF